MYIEEIKDIAKKAGEIMLAAADPKVKEKSGHANFCTETDEKIRKAIHTQLPEMTKIIIAQRISSVERCDRIIVMDNGIVTGFDTHENLLKTNTLYQEIYAIQKADKGDFDKPEGGAA